MSARGVLHVHSCPPALTPHVEWAVSGELGVRVTLSWSDQPASAGALRAECGWKGRPGTAGRIAATLRGWSLLRFEVTEEPSPGYDGERYSHTPTLGLWRSTTSANGDVMVGEDRLRAVLEAHREPALLAHELHRLLGTAWDAELEPYRRGADGVPATWLHQVV